MSARTRSALFALVLALFAAMAGRVADGKAIPKSTRVLKSSLEEKDAEGFGWHEWLHAFELADTDGDGKLHTDDIPALFKEHFNKIMAAVPHPSNENAVTREDESVFLQDAELFRKHVQRNGTPDHDDFSFHDFKKMMTNFMHAKADLSAALKRSGIEL